MLIITYLFYITIPSISSIYWLHYLYLSSCFTLSMYAHRQSTGMHGRLKTDRIKQQCCCKMQTVSRTSHIHLYTCIWMQSSSQKMMWQQCDAASGNVHIKHHCVLKLLHASFCYRYISTTLAQTAVCLLRASAIAEKPFRLFYMFLPNLLFRTKNNLQMLVAWCLSANRQCITCVYVLSHTDTCLLNTPDFAHSHLSHSLSSHLLPFTTLSTH